MRHSHTDTRSHTQPCTQPQRVSHRHTRRATHALNHTKSHSGIWRVGAGSGRRLQLRKRPRPPSLPLTPLLPHAVPAPGAAWPGLGNSSASRRLQAPRNPIRHSPRPSQGGGPRAPPTLRVQPSPPGRSHPHPETAPNTILRLRPGPTDKTHILQTPFWNLAAGWRPKCALTLPTSGTGKGRRLPKGGERERAGTLMGDPVFSLELAPDPPAAISSPLLPRASKATLGERGALTPAQAPSDCCLPVPAYSIRTLNYLERSKAYSPPFDILPSSVAGSSNSSLTSAPPVLLRRKFEGNLRHWESNPRKEEGLRLRKPLKVRSLSEERTPVCPPPHNPHCSLQPRPDFSQ